MLKRLERLRWWVQKTMPAIYDDSLSYYELLSKVLKILTEMGEIINEQSSIIEAQTEEITQLRVDYETFINTVNQTIDDAISDMRDLYNEFTTQMNQSFETFTTNINNRITQLTADLQTQMTEFMQVVNARLSAMSDDLDERISDLEDSYNTFVNTINHNFSELSTNIMEMLETVTRQFNLYMGNMVDVDIEYEGAILTKNGTLYTTSNFVADEPAVTELSTEYKGYRFEIPADGTTVHCTNFTGLPAGVVGAILTRMERHSGDLTFAEYVKEIVFSGNANTSFEYRVDYHDYPQGANYLNDFAIMFIVPADTDIDLEYKIKTNQMMVVNVVQDLITQVYNADKTYDEIMEAFDNNIPVYCHCSTLATFSPVSKDGRRMVLVSRISSTGNYSCLEMVENNSITYWTQVLWTQSTT